MKKMVIWLALLFGVQVLVASGAYTVTMVNDHTLGLRSSPYVTRTASGDSNWVVGHSAGCTDSTIAPYLKLIPVHDLYGYKITDSTASGPKLKVVMISGNHNQESSGNWGLQGAVDFWLGTTPEADYLRRHVELFVYPLSNPDGRYCLKGRGNPEIILEGYPSGDRHDDHNRYWDLTETFHISTIDALTTAMKADTGGTVDYYLDFHSNLRTFHFLTAWQPEHSYSLAVLARNGGTFQINPDGAPQQNPGMSYLWAMLPTGLNAGYSCTPELIRTAASNADCMANGASYALALYDVLASSAAPVITTQPVSQAVTVGGTATFSVAASSASPLSYQWYKYAAAISGATSSSYTTPATTMGDNGATFLVVVSNSVGNVSSNTVTLTVNAVPPAITTQPTSQTVNAGNTATFSVTASGTAPLSYQWYKNTATISGATAASYTTPATTSADNGATFYVTVTNTAGSVTSSTATLTVNASPATELIQNGGFESGTTKWSGATATIGNWPGEPAHAGSKCAWMFGKGVSTNQNLYQVLTIPSTSTTATLRFWLHVDTAETTTTQKNDKLNVNVRSSGGSLLGTLASYSNLDKNTGYLQQTLDLTPYKGQAIRLCFQGSENASLQTSFVLDDVSVLTN